MNANVTSPLTAVPGAAVAAWASARAPLAGCPTSAAAQGEAAQRPAMALADVPIGLTCQVVELTTPPGRSDLTRRLAEIGFLPGERVRILARGMPGSDPLAVRIGTSTFALRSAEAACVWVHRLEPAEPL